VAPDDTTEITQYIVNRDAKNAEKPTHWDGSMLSGEHLERFEQDIKRIEEIALRMNKLQ
jgi:hypothetical protein